MPPTEPPRPHHLEPAGSTVQSRANQANAQQSTGPKTSEGKARASMNAVRHGLTAKSELLPGESEADFERLLEAVREYHQPSTAMEEELVFRKAVILQKLRRRDRFEALIARTAYTNAELLAAKLAHIKDEAEREKMKLAEAVALLFGTASPMMNVGRLADALMREWRMIETELQRAAAARRGADDDA